MSDKADPQDQILLIAERLRILSNTDNVDMSIELLAIAIHLVKCVREMRKNTRDGVLNT